MATTAGTELLRRADSHVLDASVLLGFAATAAISQRIRPRPGRDLFLETSRELEQFLKSVEQRAFRIARLTLRNDEDALDALQEAMIKLTRSYAKRPPAEWTPLFYRILGNCVRDIQRMRQSRGRIFAWFSQFTGAGGGTADAPDPVSEEQCALDELVSNEGLSRLQQAISALPMRQQQAFLLRTVEELDVRETAIAMGCSEGSVKTHYSRAIQALRVRLGDEL